MYIGEKLTFFYRCTSQFFFWCSFPFNPWGLSTPSQQHPIRLLGCHRDLKLGGGEPANPLRLEHPGAVLGAFMRKKDSKSQVLDGKSTGSLGQIERNLTFLDEKLMILAEYPSKLTLKFWDGMQSFLRVYAAEEMKRLPTLTDMVPLVGIHQPFCVTPLLSKS